MLGCCPAANVATLYVVGVPAGDPDDISLRALRVLGEVGCIVAGGVVPAQRLLDRYELDTRLASLDDVHLVADMLESSMPEYNGSVVVSDGQQVWVYLPEENKVMVEEIGPGEPTSPPSPCSPPGGRPR